MITLNHAMHAMLPNVLASKSANNVLTCGLCLADGSVAGDVVYLEGSAPSGSYPKQLKSDIWKKIVAEFKAIQGAACCANHKLCTQKGVISVPSDMPDGSGIH